MLYVTLEWIKIYKNWEGIILARLLNWIGAILIIGSFVVGIPVGLYMDSFWSALSMILSGFLGGMLFVALGVILHQAEENREYLLYIADLLPKPEQPAGPPRAPAKKDARSALDKLKDYKL